MYLLLVHVFVVAACILHILMRKHRLPESRVAWLVVVLVLPYAGALGYLLFGQTNVGRKRVARLEQVFHTLPNPQSTAGWDAYSQMVAVNDEYAGLFRVARATSGYRPAGGNRASLLPDSDTVIEAMVADINVASDHVHLFFYIWLGDHNGRKVANALIRAAARGVACRAMVDDIGSRDLLRSALWKDLQSAGVQTRSALTVGNPLLRIFKGRIDLRNHRKILVIDNRVTYCGSQNCADAAFLRKARYAPWVDAVMRFTGPVVRQNQHLFISDWMGNGGEDISSVLRQPMPAPQRGFTAPVAATGPTFRHSAMSDMFATLMYAARRELFITTPYYVPDAAVQQALCACGDRGVEVTIIFPARNDDFLVAATSRSYYEDLLSAGVKIYEFQPGLLHTKSLTMDGEITLIGSANMDRRSFELNYENNILLRDRNTTAMMRTRQAQYLAQSRSITLDEVHSWGVMRRLWQNTLAVVGPIL